MTIERAIQVAAVAHEGQKDKAGVSYILHPLRVMFAFPGDDIAQMVAVLHDVVEDTDVTLDDLHAEFPACVVAAVDCLTRRKAAGETYMAFVARTATNPIAKRVKVADIMDNMSRATPDLAHLKQRYTKALLFLQATT